MIYTIYVKIFKNIQGCMFSTNTCLLTQLKHCIAFKVKTQESRFQKIYYHTQELLIECSYIPIYRYFIYIHQHSTSDLFLCTKVALTKKRSIIIECSYTVIQMTNSRLFLLQDVIHNEETWLGDWRYAFICIFYSMIPPSLCVYEIPEVTSFLMAFKSKRMYTCRYVLFQSSFIFVSRKSEW